MHIWGVDGSSVDHANLNATGAGGFDAIVDANAGAAVGPVYATVTAALAAGHRSIMVRSGAYAAGFAITSGMSGVRIFGEHKPYMSGSTIISGARFAGAITIEGTSHVLENIGVHGVAGHGFDVIAPYCALIGCVAGGCTQTGIIVRSPQWGATVANCTIHGGGNGIIISPSAAGDTVMGVEVVQNWITSTTGYGILVGNSALTGTTSYRSVGVRGNMVRACATSFGHGISVWTAQDGAMIEANHVNQCGSPANNPDACGIRVVVPGATPYPRTTVVGNHVIGNRGYGISLSAASARVAVAANAVIGNGAGGFQNCASCPGYDSAATYGTNVGS